MKLSSLLVLILALAAGWTILHRGHAFPPAVIADNVTDYSHAQRLAMHQEDILPGHMYLDDWTYIPRPISYVRVEYLASEVTKPLPKVYVSDTAFPPNSWIGERVAVAGPKAMPPVFSSAADLPCASDSGDLTAGADRFEVRIRKGNAPLLRCLIDHDTGCRYVRTLRVLTGDVLTSDMLADQKRDTESPLALLQRLAKCPKILH